MPSPKPPNKRPPVEDALSAFDALWTADQIIAAIKPFDALPSDEPKLANEVSRVAFWLFTDFHFRDLPTPGEHSVSLKNLEAAVATTSDAVFKLHQETARLLRLAAKEHPLKSNDLLPPHLKGDRGEDNLSLALRGLEALGKWAAEARKDIEATIGSIGRHRLDAEREAVRQLSRLWSSYRQQFGRKGRKHPSLKELQDVVDAALGPVLRHHGRTETLAGIVKEISDANVG
jgi:hypothetical protein